MSLLTLLALTFTLTQQAAVPQQAALSGTVLEAGTDKPVAGAQVTLISFVLRPQPGRPPEPLVATTDQNGRYRFDALEPGRYRVSVQKPGFATMPGPGLPEATLKAGERTSDLNLTIQRGAAIVGRVLDENGEPIANANVMAWRRPAVPNGAASAARPGLPRRLCRSDQRPRRVPSLRSGARRSVRPGDLELGFRPVRVAAPDRRAGDLLSRHR
jgi:hypothetical protein